MREVLGNVYYRLNEFEKAIAAFEEVLLQKPDELNIYNLVGFSYVQLFFGCRNPDLRNSYYQEAVTYLKKTLELCQSDQQHLKGSINNFLGRLHFGLGKYEEAISCFRISYIQKSAPWTSKYYLGYAYLKIKHYDQSMKQFNDLRQLNEQSYPDDDKRIMSFDEISVMTLWGIAFNYAERDVSLTEALKLIEEAQKNIQPNLDDVKANCLDCKGWILLKLSWVDNQPDKVDEAIVCLKEALALQSDALFYLHLALAYEQKLQTSLNDAQFQALYHLVKIYSQHAQELDLNNEFEQSLTDLSTRLEQKRKEKQQKSSQDQELSKPTTNGH